MGDKDNTEKNKKSDTSKKKENPWEALMQIQQQQYKAQQETNKILNTELNTKLNTKLDQVNARLANIEKKSQDPCILQ
jgi:molecular chaperone GrpE (heat shock protein)